MRRPLPTDITVGHQLRMRRKMLGISQSDLAEKLGITFQQIQKYESGKNRISASRLQQLASVLGVDPCFFFDDYSAMGSDLETAIIRDFVGSTDGMNLIQAFGRIRSRGLRKSVVSLVQQISETNEF